jgi:HlyD family secretion protein
MEPTDQPHLKRKGTGARDATALEFLPDADAIERSPLAPYMRITVHMLALALLLLVLCADVVVAVVLVVIVVVR